MPGKIKVKILAGRNLPVMDRSGDTTDAYVEIKFGNTTFKTDVCRKSLNPQWNSEWYRFEVDDAELQDEPLQVRLMDHDTYSANDAIGKVYVNLNPLLLPGLPPTVKNIWTLEASINSSSGSQGGSVMTGWIPVFDTMHGIRGEVNIIVKVELFSDCNKFRQSSCGVQFFYSPKIPHGYHAQVIHGFVEELVVSDDPEYKWIDKIRTPRASNEARQTLFFKLSGEVQRKIGLKALDLGGNAVIGYVQNFDLEGESGIVARGIGTAVTLVKLQDISSILPLENSNIEELTCFDLQSKNQPDLSESDDSLPLLDKSSNHSPKSYPSTNVPSAMTTISPCFPHYEKNHHGSRHGIRIAEYRAAGLRARQLSLQQTSTSIVPPMSKVVGGGSSLSLADDLISESSLKNMLALEDMRGEPISGNPFSRGFKNFRYLHQNILLSRRIAQIKSKISDSFDTEESDFEGSCSSTWSLTGTESKGSIVHPGRSIRRRKNTHKKTAGNDGIAALLIRSVHSGYPLDSVSEDRETPAPSPVNLFIGDSSPIDNQATQIVLEDTRDSGDGDSISSKIDNRFTENQILLGPNKYDVKYTANELRIPMISSSETDTSTSDDDDDDDDDAYDGNDDNDDHDHDDDDDDDESSTNYNILDDSISLNDPTSLDDTSYQSNLNQSTLQLTESPKLDGNHEKYKNTKELQGETMSCKGVSVSNQEISSPCSEVERINEAVDEQRVAQLASDSNDITFACGVLAISASDSDSVDDNLERSSGGFGLGGRVRQQSTITLRECHSISSTNYHFLDEPYSVGDTVDDPKIRESPTSLVENTTSLALMQHSCTKLEESMKNRELAINDLCFENREESSTHVDSLGESHLFDNTSTVDPKILQSPDSSDPMSTALVKNKELQKKVETSESSFESETMNLSTDDNNLNESSMVSDRITNHPISAESTTSVITIASSSALMKIQEPMETLKGEITNESSLENEVVESNPEHTMQDISSTLKTNILTYSDLSNSASPSLSQMSEVLDPIPDTPLYASKSSSSSGDSSPLTTTTTKLRHIKFLPKQKQFDRSEDLELVTNTPVEFPYPLLGKSENFLQPSLENPKSDLLLEVKIEHEVDQEICLQTPKKEVYPLEISLEKIKIVDVKKEMTPSRSKKEKTGRKIERTDTVIYKGPAIIDRDKEKCGTPVIPIVAPTEESATRLKVPVIQTTNINVQSTFSSDEMKTQHSGSTGSRKFLVDDWATSDKFGRKYRQHCILDLIKTIDAKMMVHHSHHERHDSTRSKRNKRRDIRINVSATPSPDSIHRTRPHKNRRSKSRSPEKQQHHQNAHSKTQLPSLCTHSFPNNSGSLCNSSVDNLSINISASSAPAFVRSSKPNVQIFHKDKLSISTVNHHDENVSNNTKEFCMDMTLEESSSSGCKTDQVELEIFNSVESKESPVPKFKRKNGSAASDADSLSHLVAPIITKTTNNTSRIDDLRVHSSPLTLRQQDEEPQVNASVSSPHQTPSALPSSLGSKVTPNPSTATKTNTAIPNIHRRSSDSDLSITPKGNSLAGSDRSMGGHIRATTAIVRTMNQDTMEMLEYPFITMQQYPPGFVLSIGGLVSARSVKLLERITNLEEPEGRDAWWTEIRMEVRSHARALACNVVLGYKEEISICDDVCVLNASGTAAVINLLNVSNQDQENLILGRNLMTTSVESERDKIQVKSLNLKSEKIEETPSGQQQQSSSGKIKLSSESNDNEITYQTPPPILSPCSLCHLAYSEASVPFRVDVSKCTICRRAKVPDVLFATIELPDNIPMTGRGVFLQATVCKSKRDLRAELNAKEISDCLPFLEYELHSLLLNKLKVKGMNAIFGLKVQVSVGERLVIGMAVGTAVYLTALPTPPVPQIASGNSWHNEEQLADIQKTLIETVKKNREFYRLIPINQDSDNGRSVTASDTDESDDDLLPDLDLGIGTKDACVLEVDDIEDMDRIYLLMDDKPPDDFHVVNTQTIPGLEDLEIVRNLQMFTQISRAKIPSGQLASMPSKYFARMLQTVLFKLRRMVPCALCDMQFKVALPEQDEIQLSVVGMALGLGEPTRFSKHKRKIIPNSASKDPIKKTDDNDMIFNLDEEHTNNSSTRDSRPAANYANANVSVTSPVSLPSVAAQKQHRPRSPFRAKTHISHRHKHVPLKERYGVDITPLSYLPGGKIDRYLGNLNFFFIRESTSIRENGGLSGFTHSFVTEILAIVRAHITALGGNAMVAFFMTQCVLLHSPHKNQGQCLINVGGDVVTVSYYGNDNHLLPTTQNC